MSGVVNTGSFSKRLWPGVDEWVGDSYNQYQKEYDRIFDMRISDKRYEEIVGLVGMGLGVIKEEGGGVSYASPKQGYTSRFVNTVYGLGFVITMEVLDDDQYSMNLAEMGARKLGISMAQTKETIAANVLNNSENSSYLGGDGVVLLSTAHPLYGVGGGTFQNKPTTDADLSEASLEQAIIDIGGYLDDAGLKVKVLAKELIVPRQLAFEAKRILGSDQRVSTADNDINALKSFGSIPTWSINHYLTSSTGWFIKTDAPYGMVGYQREKYTLTSDNDFDTENAKFKVMERYSFGWADPRGIYGSIGP